MVVLCVTAIIMGVRNENYTASAWAFSCLIWVVIATTK